MREGRLDVGAQPARRDDGRSDIIGSCEAEASTATNNGAAVNGLSSVSTRGQYGLRRQL